MSISEGQVPCSELAGPVGQWRELGCLHGSTTAQQLHVQRRRGGPHKGKSAEACLPNRATAQEGPARPSVGCSTQTARTRRNLTVPRLWSPVGSSSAARVCLLSTSPHRQYSLVVRFVSLRQTGHGRSCACASAYSPSETNQLERGDICCSKTSKQHFQRFVFNLFRVACCVVIFIIISFLLVRVSP